jgi:hypothetical protein
LIEFAPFLEFAVWTGGAGTGLKAAIPHRLELSNMPVELFEQSLELSLLSECFGYMVSILFE